jgi:hypothetical protein
MADVLAPSRERATVAQQLLVQYSRADTLREQRNIWWQFLQSFEASYVKLHAAAEATGGRLLGWFGGVRRERKSDPLLSYLLHARNADQHGLELVVEAQGAGWTDGVMGMSHGPPGDDESLKQWVENVRSTIGEYEIFTLDPSPEGGRWLTQEEIEASGMGIRVYPPHYALTPVTDRSVTYAVPDHHLGQPLIDISPLNIGALAYLWLVAKIEDAERIIL